MEKRSFGGHVKVDVGLGEVGDLNCVYCMRHAYIMLDGIQFKNKHPFGTIPFATLCLRAIVFFVSMQCTRVK